MVSQLSTLSSDILVHLLIKMRPLDVIRLRRVSDMAPSTRFVNDLV